jgi:hypothetical protein
MSGFVEAAALGSDRARRERGGPGVGDIDGPLYVDGTICAFDDTCAPACASLGTGNFKGKTVTRLWPQIGHSQWFRRGSSGIWRHVYAVQVSTGRSWSRRHEIARRAGSPQGKVSAYRKRSMRYPRLQRVALAVRSASRFLQPVERRSRRAHCSNRACDEVTLISSKCDARADRLIFPVQHAALGCVARVRDIIFSTGQGIER